MTVEAKAREYLAAGRLTVTYATLQQVAASCAGSAPEPYELSWTAWNGWRCTCPTRGPGCSHLAALRLVVELAELEDAEEHALPPRAPPPAGPDGPTTTAPSCTGAGRGERRREHAGRTAHLESPPNEEQTA